MAKKSVVVLGAGFGGLRATMDIAKRLRRLKLLDKYEVVLVDHNDCHLYTPLLYKVAASADDQYEAKCTYEISALVKDLPVRFVESEIASLDLPAGDVHLKTGDPLHADYLVIALGSETNYFGIKGLRENSLQLKSVENALQIRAAISKAFAKGGDVKIIAGGGGPNGIELAAEMRDWADRAEKQNPTLHVSVSIVEAMATPLTGLDPHIQKTAAERLKKLGITLMLNAKIVSVTPDQIFIGPGIGSKLGSTIPFDVFIWTGGIKTPDMLTQLPLVKDAHGKPMAKNNMSCVPETPDLKLASMVYALGDSACIMSPKTGKPVPAVARVAITEGSIVAGNIIEEIKRTELSSHTFLSVAYRPRNYPYVIPIGEKWATAKFGPFVFSGWLAWAFSRAIEINYLRTVMSLGDAIVAWQKM
jgi:NADH dehydrogenase